jgi:transcriptional regulator with XRE-family HTH domain
MTTKSSFYSLVRRTMEMPDFFGALLHRFRQQENLSEQDVLRHLRTTPAMFARLALCRLPNSNSPEFLAQMRQIASFTKIDVERLIRIFRQVESIEALSQPKNIVTLERHTESPLEGLLAAAREREGTTEAPKKPKQPTPEDQK